MTEMFTRSGRAVQVRDGVTSITQDRQCGRCGGAGRSDKWAHTGYTCYDCGGSGKRGFETIKLYTAEKLAKLDAAKAKADAKRAAKAAEVAAKRAAEVAARSDAFKAEHAALISRAAPYMTHDEDRPAGFIESVMTKAIADCWISENQVVAVNSAIDKIEETSRKRAASGYVGKVGARIDIEVTVERVFTFYRPSFRGYGDEAVHIVTMRDIAGNAIVSKSASFWSEEGKKFTIRATVKEHGSYKDECQTIVARVAVKDRQEAA
jgi:hypothetical protein